MLITAFLILGSMDEKLAAQKIGESFPALRNVSIHSFNVYDQIKNIAPSDAIISTLWATAYFALRINNVKRKFYFIQDYEPLFYPAGTISAQTEATYSFGFYGIANTPPIKDIYESRFGGKAEFFIPCVDTDLFYPRESLNLPEQPYKVFFYGRPQHPRNGFELGANSLRILKKRMGDSIRIISAGDTWHPRDHDLLGVVENLGRLAYQDTCELYRQCRAGVTMMFTNHPSYLPLELMASGCLVITNANPATSWLLKDGYNCRLTRASATCIADTIEEVLNMDDGEYTRITSNALDLIRSQYQDWDREIEKIFRFMCRPL